MARTKGLSTILISARLTENVVCSIGEVTKATGRNTHLDHRDGGTRLAERVSQAEGEAMSDKIAAVRARLIKRFAKIEADKDARLIQAVITELSQSKLR